MLLVVIINLINIGYYKYLQTKNNNKNKTYILYSLIYVKCTYTFMKMT